jgi:hypothetical protein
VAAVAAVGAALAPLALHQRAQGHTSFNADLSLRTRITDLPKKLVTGELGTPTPLIGPIAGLIAVAAIAYALRERQGRILLMIAAAAALLPLVLAVAGADYLLPRNLIAVYVPVVLVVAAGLGAAGRLGLAAATAICAVALVVNIEVASDAKLQRDDWRGAAKALGPATETRAVIVSPDYAKKPLRLYAGSLPPLPAGTAVREVDVIVNDRPPAGAPPALPGFSLDATVRTPSYLLARYRSSTPIPVPMVPVGRKPAAYLIQKGPNQ